jgi:CBS domain-containing protein
MRQLHRAHRGQHRIDQDTEDVMHTMGHAQVRRLPVLNVDGELVGIVSIGDMARRQPGPVDQTVREVSEPPVAGSA